MNFITDKLESNNNFAPSLLAKLETMLHIRQETADRMTATEFPRGLRQRKRERERERERERKRGESARSREAQKGERELLLPPAVLNTMPCPSIVHSRVLQMYTLDKAERR